ncbi:hypothetical protein ACXR0O_13555 [Verrucomicrobiota bacterium sgz303538]
MPPRAFAALLAVSIVASSAMAFAQGAASTSGNVEGPVGGQWGNAMPPFRVKKGAQIPTEGQASVEQVQQPADLRLKAGELLPGINEDFAGKASD